MRSLWWGLVVLLVGLLSGCNLFVQYYEDVDELCKKIVADWRGGETESAR